MQIPLSFAVAVADTVIGEGGLTISYSRRSSRATITVEETRGIPSEMMVEMYQWNLQTAQQLLNIRSYADMFFGSELCLVVGLALEFKKDMKR